MKKKEPKPSTNTEAMDKTKKHPSSKIMSIIYIAVIFACTALLVTLIFLTANSMKRKQELQTKEAEVIRQYEDIAKQHENFKDEDYAEVYFEGNTMYIPAENIIIEFHP